MFIHVGNVDADQYIWITVDTLRYQNIEVPTRFSSVEISSVENSVLKSPQFIQYKLYARFQEISDSNLRSVVNKL